MVSCGFVTIQLPRLIKTTIVIMSTVVNQNIFLDLKFLQQKRRVIKKKQQLNMFSAWVLLFLTKTLWPGFVEPLSCGDFGSAAAAVLVVVAWPAGVFAVGSP